MASEQNAKTTKDKLPPQNVEAEQSILGALLIDKEAITKVADFLVFDDFYRPVHQKIYATMVELYQRHEPIDILNLTSRLKERNLLQDIGGTSYLASLANLVPTASHVVSYAKSVQQKRILRDLISVSYNIAELGYQEEREMEEVLDEVEQKIFQVTQRSVGEQFRPIKPDLVEAFTRIEKLHRGEKPLRGISTGFPALDSKLSGLQRSDLIILASRPSLGKTTLALDIARNAALKENVSVGIFSLEMSRDQLVDRMLSAESGVDAWRIRTGKLNDETDFDLLHQGINRLSGAPIYIEDSSSSNIMRIRTMARRLQAEHGLDLLVVDYLQLIMPRDNRNNNIVQQITEISRGLKALARELNVPILAVSQLSRAIEQRDHKWPRLSDLRESGSIEQDADIVMFIYRKDRDKLEDELSEEEKNTAEIIIAKHRNGPLGTIRLKFIPELVTFRPIDETFQNEEGGFNATSVFE